jgi:hypothetical protein
MDLLESVGENFNIDFVMKEFQQIVNNFVNELRSSRLLIDGRGENLNAYGGKVR